jgi:dTDP-4-amino-4,6-dideoxygalactose transaminase
LIAISRPCIGEKEKAAVMQVLDSGILSQGPKTALFEEEFARLCGVKHAIAVSSGTSALHIALLAHNVGPGDEVITTPFTFAATANAILFVGATPVFVDIEKETFNIDLDLIEQAVTPRTRAIIPVHLYGHMCDMEKLQAIADRHGLIIIEDACQAVCASFQGRFAGSFSTAAFSLYGTKNITCGEGGMITTNDDEIAETCRLLRSHGMKQRYHHERLGYNFRMSEIAGAIGLAQLERVVAFAEQRRANAAYLSHHIKTLITPVERDGAVHAWHQYTVRVNGHRDRDEVADRLNQAGIGTGIYYPVPLHRQTYLREIVGEITLPVAERMAREVLSLPVHPQLSQADLETIVYEVNRL